MQLDCKFNSLKRDKTIIPKWAQLVTRWHQLDDESYLVAEACFNNKDFIGTPDLIYFSSKEGSIPTDKLFINADRFSPSHFVHTLPNVRSLSLSLVLGWEGPLLCNSYGENTLSSCLASSMAQLSNGKKEILIVNLSYSNKLINIDLLKLDQEGKRFWKISASHFTDLKSDDEILEELKMLRGITSNTISIKVNK